MIVGGGFAGVGAACFLAERGVHVTLLEAREDVGRGASGRFLGHCISGLVEHPHRVVHALGEARARDLYRFCRRGVALLDERLGLGDEQWWAAVDEREPGQLAESAAVLAVLGIDAELVEGPAVDAAFGGSGFGPALRVREGGVLGPGAIADLAGQARAAGARLVGSARVDAVTEDVAGLRVVVGEDRIRAEVVIFAAEAGLSAVDPWFEAKLTPVREHALATAPLDHRLGSGGRAGYGYTFWRQLADGRLCVGGARWATPHLEVGEGDDTVTSPAVQARLEAFLRARFPTAAAEVAHRWSWITTHSCDGIPLVGPLPGSPRRIACAGFGGNEAVLALRAAEAVTQGLLDEREPDVPAFFAPARFL